MRLTILTAFVLFAAGCQDVPARQYASLRAACDVPEGTFTPNWFPWSEAMRSTSAKPVSEECARKLGAVVGLDWAAFGGHPHSFSTPVSRPETVVAALLVLLTSDLGTLAELQEATGPDEGLGRLFFGAEPPVIGEPGDPAGLLWLQLIEQGIHRVVPADPECESTSPVVAFIDGGVMSVCGTSAWSGNHPGTVAFTGVLAHEASHSFLGGHDGEGGTKDTTPARVWGVEARLVDTWFVHADRAELDWTACNAAAMTLIGACNSIEDASGFSACSDTIERDAECRALYAE